ncbi:MAG: PDDEXK nuclease domain-containing protein [Prevotellaceae bacterium]|jgi:predicted nuclease of restriction endonuclease-like (RecB) superfamily|nr:PDDEXK nuclease domain-containing protein [Prevotellaceae bacterium]
MNFIALKQGIEQLSNSFRQSVAVAINSHLTIRNWLIGYYIVKFEQNGEDRAKYGAKLLQNLAESFNNEGLSYRNLRLFRQFYLVYPQVEFYIPAFLQRHYGEIWQSPTAKLQLPEFQSIEIGHSVSAQFKEQKNEIPTLPVEKLIHKLSFTHLSLLFPIDNPLKRVFYEMECIKGTWSVRELKRQIDSLYFERMGLSRKPELLSQIVQDNSLPVNMIDTIKQPMVFDFLGLKAKDVVYESDLEQALIEHLEDFLVELGHGFCYEARQKRILIGDEYYFCDLVFYNRILKCHVLIELKIGAFSHEHFGQLKTYINYYRKEIMRPDDNPPMGILLVTDKNTALVEYATADSDKEIFVSKYVAELPTKEQFIEFMNKEFEKL